VLQPPSIPPMPRKATQTAIGRQRDARNRLMMGERTTSPFCLSFPPIQAVLLASSQALRPLPAPTGLSLGQTGQNDRSGAPRESGGGEAREKPHPSNTGGSGPKPAPSSDSHHRPAAASHDQPPIRPPVASCWRVSCWQASSGGPSSRRSRRSRASSPRWRAPARSRANRSRG